MKYHFLKTTRSLFGKLVVSRIFGFVLSCTILMALSGLIGSVITQLCGVMLLIVLQFTTAWEIGSKDYNRIETRQIKRDPWLGLKAGLLASSLDIIAAICLLLTKAGVVGEAYPIFFGIFNCNYLPFHQAILSPTLTVAEHNVWGYVLSASTVLIAPICCTIGYRLGLSQVSLAEIFFYTTPESRQRHKERIAKRKNRKRFGAR